MAAIDFPNSPVSGQVHIHANRAWKWNSVIWSPIISSFSGVSSDEIWDSKGDLSIGTGSDSASKLSASSTVRDVLYTDSSTSTGLNYGDPALLEYFFHDWTVGSWNYDGGSSTPDIYGMATCSAVGTGTLVNQAASRLRHGSYVSVATTGSTAGVYSNINNHFLTHEWIMVIWGGVDTLTNIRFAVGVADNIVESIDYDEGLSTEGAWFRYSTSASDTTWKCITSNDTVGSPTITDTGVTVTTGTKKFMIHRTTSDIKFYLDDVLVATHTTALPDNAVTAGISMRAKTLADESATVHFVQCLVLTKIP